MSDDQKTAADETTHESPVGETLDAEGFSDTEDALKGADVKSGSGNAEAEKMYDEQSDKKVAGSTEDNPNVEGPDGRGRVGGAKGGRERGRAREDSGNIAVKTKDRPRR